MRKLSLLFLLSLVPIHAHAGQLGTPLPWISDATSAGALVLNNDDYVGAFAENPNRFKVNEGRRQSIVDTERIIGTVASGGITEFALSIGGHFDSDDPSGVSLDSVFLVQLGFGIGDDFVRARDVAPDLRFDLPESVSPAIEDYTILSDDVIPVLKLIEHQSDTLVYQGSSTNGFLTEISGSDPELFQLPLDIPDLPVSVRDFYSADALASLSTTEVPFTIRVGPVVVPEPSAGMLTAVACLVITTFRRRKNSRESCGLSRGQQFVI